MHLALHRTGAAAAVLGRPLRGRASLALCLVTVGLTMLLALAESASASHHQFRVGVIDGTVDPASDVRGMGTIGAEVFRTFFHWGRIETSRGTRGRCNAKYDWSYTDRLVAAASVQNLELLPFILGSPGYAASTEKAAPATSSGAIGDYKCFVKKTVARYGRGGQYPTTINPAANPITEWQVWNEPSLKTYAVNRRPNPREYARLLKVTRRQILSKDPRATIVMAGLPEFTSRGIDAKPYLKRFYEVPGIKRHFDVLALHPYARNVRGVKGAMVRLRRLLRQVGDPRRTVWITETGWATDGPKGHYLVKTEQGQAQQLTKTFNMLRSNRKRFKVGTVNWFRWRDIAASAEGAFSHAGLYKVNGGRKLSCYRFANQTGGQCQPLVGGEATAAGGTDLGSQAVEPSPAE